MKTDINRCIDYFGSNHKVSKAKFDQLPDLVVPHILALAGDNSIVWAETKALATRLEKVATNMQAAAIKNIAVGVFLSSNRLPKKKVNLDYNMLDQAALNAFEEE